MSSLLRMLNYSYEQRQHVHILVHFKLEGKVCLHSLATVVCASKGRLHLFSVLLSFSEMQRPSQCPIEGVM